MAIESIQSMNSSSTVLIRHYADLKLSIWSDLEAMHVYNYLMYVHCNEFLFCMEDSNVGQQPNDGAKAKKWNSWYKKHSTAL